MAEIARVFVSLGSNVERERHLPRAVAMIEQRFGALALSPVFESEPVGFAGDPFFNLVAGFDTALGPRRTVQVLRGIEARCGRDRDQSRYGPRTLDADLLLYGALVLAEPDLILPREEILAHAFVLRPLAEIAGEVRHPVLGRPFSELWAEFEAPGQRLWAADFDLDRALAGIGERGLA